MADHMHGCVSFALWDDEKEELFCLRDQFGTNHFIIMKLQMAGYYMGQPSIISWTDRIRKRVE